jgi:hypothetical protein
VAPTPSERHTSSRRIGACASWVVLWRWTGRLTEMGDVGAGTDATLREFENGVRGRSSRHLDPEGGGGRTRLLFFATAFTTRRRALAARAPRRETDTAYGRAAAFGVEAPGTTEFPRRSSMSMQGQGPASRGRVGHGGALRGDPLASDRAFPLCRATGASWPPQWRSRAIA